MATSDKYDRQLRLWGASGQAALSSTLVVLIGSSACGTESLKNLVLPGVGAFLIVDDVVYDDGVVNGEISASDGTDVEKLQFTGPTSNFFAGPSAGSSTKAAMACSLLCELNPDVSGYHCTVPSLEKVDYPTFLSKLQNEPPKVNGAVATSSILVISADQPSPVLLPLSWACHSLSLSLINVRSYGLLGYVRVQTPSPYHVVKDAKKTNKLEDLRLSAGASGVFPGLKRVYDSIGKLDTITDSKDHGHVPYIIILLQALEKWNESHNGAPNTYDEKEEFRSMVKSMSNDYGNELNFQEAHDQAHLVWADDKISDQSKEVLDRCTEEIFYAQAIDADMDTECSSKTVNMAVLQFQLMTLALKQFLNDNGDVPPLDGTIPDMASDTKTFVALQEAYRAQAELDRSKLTQQITKILEACKAKSNGCKVCVEMPSEEDIVTFCKNSRDINILETRPLYAEYKCQDPCSPIVNSLSKSLDLDTAAAVPNFDTLQSDSREDLMCATMDPYETDPMQTPLLWFIAIRACDAFYDRHGHYPGKHDQNLALEADANEVFKLMAEVVGNMGLKDCDFILETLLNNEKGKDVAREVVRYDEAEIHTIAAVMGGVASQEAVKLITGQYVPLNDTYIYNGIASTASVHRF